MVLGADVVRISDSLSTAADQHPARRARVSLRSSIRASITATFADWNGSYYWPAGWAFNSSALITVEAQVTAGTGTVRAAIYQLTGVQSP